MERRKFLQQAAAAAALAGWKAAAGQATNGNTELTGAAALTPLPVVSTSNGIGRRKLGRADVEVSIIGIGGYHIGLPTSPNRRPFASSAPPWIGALIFSITAGTTTTAPARSAWGKPSPTAIATKLS